MENHHVDLTQWTSARFAVRESQRRKRLKLQKKLFSCRSDVCALVGGCKKLSETSFPDKLFCDFPDLLFNYGFYPGKIHKSTPQRERGKTFRLGRRDEEAIVSRAFSLCGKSLSSSEWKRRKGSNERKERTKTDRGKCSKGDEWGAGVGNAKKDLR
ncbi:hypothetical protein RUM43_009054 [Polyplax serrata]|uniref:Uncharacterized protein n=1 Tax=Polyplax serrata TaxID=468196 RepID=A0AAN8NVC5_POLSC